jgi:hypothetical protein
MKEQRIERQQYAIQSPLLLPEGYDESEDRIKLNNHQEEDRIRQKNEAGKEKVGLTEVPLFQDLESNQISQSKHVFPLMVWFSLRLLF